MQLNRPKWGTCGRAANCPDGCRWYLDSEEGRGCIGGRPVMFDVAGAMMSGFPSIEPDMTCGEWEPPEGKVCGNCSLVLNGTLVRVTGQQKCSHDETLHGMYDTCPAWRWRGPEDDS